MVWCVSNETREFYNSAFLTLPPSLISSPHKATPAIKLLLPLSYSCHIATPATQTSLISTPATYHLVAARLCEVELLCWS